MPSLMAVSYMLCIVQIFFLIPKSLCIPQKSNRSHEVSLTLIDSLIANENVCEITFQPTSSVAWATVFGERLVAFYKL